MKSRFPLLALAAFTACAALAAPPAPLYAPDLASLAGAGARAETGAAPDGGDALVFDGSSESGVKLQVSDTFRRALSGEEVSASFWFRLDAPSESDIAAGFFACPRYYDSAPVQFKLATKPTDFGTFHATSLIEHRVVNGVWHHAAFSFSLSNLSYSVYFDGQVEAVRPIDSDLPSPVNLDSLLKPLGARNFKGAVASLRIWNRALSRDDLLAFKPSPAEAARLEGAFRQAAGAKNKGFSAAAAAVADGLHAKAAGCDVRDWQTAARVARDLPVLSQWADAAAGAGAFADAPFAASTFYAYSPDKHLPFELPAHAKPATELSLALAKGEYEAATFMLHPLRDVAKLEISANPLSAMHPNDCAQVLHPDALDIRVVKCWYTTLAGWNTYFAGGRENPALAPELLMHDDALVVADTEKRANLLRVNYASGTRYVDISRAGTKSKSSHFNYVTSPVADAPGPMPSNVALRFGEGRQFWVTVHAPKDALQGTYFTSIEFVADGKPAGSLPLTVEIRPYALPVARTRYDPSREYLGGMMSHCGLEIQVELGHSLEVAERRYLAEMRNMAAHNILHPFAPSFNDENPLKDLLAERQFDLMRAAGCSLDFVFGGGPAFEPGWLGASREGATAEKNPDLYAGFMKRYEKRIQHTAKRFDEVVGHRNACFYGLDEAGPATVRNEFRFFAVLQRYGFMAFTTSGSAPYANFVTDINDIPAGIRDATAARWHAAGARAVSYAAPFTGPENPEAWRRNKGLRMYLANYDGIAEYIWYEGFNIWNEFITPSLYKNFNIVYPTADGVLDTVPWEALREAFDDIRYATLLRQLGAEAMQSPDAKTATLGRACVFWLDTVDGETIDLDAFRAEAADRIGRLLAAGLRPPAEPPAKGVKRGPLRPAAEVFRKPDAELATFPALVAESARLRKAGFHDLARPLLQRAIGFADADEAARTQARLDYAESCRLLLDDAAAAEVFRELATSQRTDPAIRAKAYAGLLKTVVAPSEYDWTPSPQTLDKALALYEEARADQRLPARDKAALVGILSKALIRGGRARKLIALCEEWLQPGPAALKGPAASSLYEHEGDAYAALRQYAKAVSRYNLVAQNAGNRFRILEKTGDNARLAKDFRKAQQAYSDLLPLIDKEENKSLYNRVSRIVVSLTKATQKATKADAASLIEQGSGDFGDLTLDE